MKILLAIPPRIVNIHRDVAYNASAPHLGVAYLAAVLRNQGYQVKVADAQVEGISLVEFGRRVRLCDPDLVGFTAFTEQIEEAHRAAQMIKEYNPRLPIVVGGCHPSALPQETLEEFPDFDFAVVGEGENTVLDLVERLNQKKSVADLAGVAYREGSRIVTGPHRHYIEDLDSLPLPAFDLFPLDRYKIFYRVFNRERNLPLLTSRGCPYSCIFCYKSMGFKVRLRSVECVLKEIRYWVENYFVSQFIIMDECFAIQRDRALKICEAIIQGGLNQRISFACQTRVDLVDREILKYFKSAGCFFVCYGVESGNRNVLTSMKKGIRPDQVEEAFRLTREAGIKSQANFIFGFPDEDRDRVKESIETAMRINPDYCVFNILSPFPGTEVMEMVKKGKGGARLISKKWSQFGKHMGSAYETDRLSRRELERLQLKAYLKFYLRFQRLGNLFRIVRIKFFPVYLWRLIFNFLFNSNRNNN